jgi:hypothetical protein
MNKLNTNFVIFNIFQTNNYLFFLFSLCFYQSSIFFNKKYQEICKNTYLLTIKITIKIYCQLYKPKLCSQQIYHQLLYFFFYVVERMNKLNTNFTTYKIRTLVKKTCFSDSFSRFPKMDKKMSIFNFLKIKSKKTFICD